jgi:putative Holliday junction resolvase
MRILGLDFGSKVIGVAISDDLTITAQPLTSIRRIGLEKDLISILEIVDGYQVAEVVVGLPVNMNGTKGESARKAEAFIEKLQGRVSSRVIPWDERLTTVAAERALLEGDMSRRKRRKVIDRVAAALILQGYLDSRSRKNENPF